MEINKNGNYYNLSLGMKYNDVKNYEQKKLFDIFDFNGNREIDENEFEFYQKNIGKDEITKEQANKYIESQKALMIELGVEHDYTKLSKMSKEELVNKGYEIMYYFEDSFEIKDKFNKIIHIKKNNSNNSIYVDIDYNNGGDYKRMEFSQEGKLLMENLGDECNNIDNFLYDKDGNIMFGKLLKDPDCEIAKLLHRDIYTKNSYKLPTTGKDFEKHLQLLNKDNIMGVMSFYKPNLIEDILSEFGINAEKRAQYVKNIVDLLCQNRTEKNEKDNKETIEYFRRTLYKEIDNAMSFPSYIFDTKEIKLLTNILNSDRILDFPIKANITTKIVNNNYEGKEYDVKDYEDIIVIKDKSSDKTIRLNLKELFKDYPEEDAFCAKYRIKQLPAEVLVDIYYEGTFSSNKLLDQDTAGGYSRFDDNISFYKNYFKPIYITHEIGHAIDFNLIFSDQNSSSFEKKYKDIFEIELENYKKSNIIFHFFDNELEKYCTTSIQEMFAECYTLLMLGDCYSKECIIKNFPRTLNIVREYIEVIRSKPENIRRGKADLNDNVLRNF